MKGVAKKRPSVRAALAETARESIAILKSRRPQEQRFHEARKKIKETRALLRLARHGLGEARFRIENTALRDAGRSLAAQRDAQVLGETLDELLRKARVSPEQGDRLREFVRSHQARLVARSAYSRDPGSAAVRGLEGFLRRVGRLPLECFDQRSLESGLRKTYKAGAKRRAVSFRKNDAHHFHEWRKSVKYSRHQIDFVSGLAGKSLERLSSSLKRLADLLGLDHDYAVLAEVLASRALRTDRTAAHLRRRIAVEQRRLRALSRALGQRLFAGSPEQFYRRVYGR
jgi:CHAD domain-containing protein